MREGNTEKEPENMGKEYFTYVSQSLSTVDHKLFIIINPFADPYHQHLESSEGDPWNIPSEESDIHTTVKPQQASSRNPEITIQTSNKIPAIDDEG